jgi:hypothetical protein
VYECGGAGKAWAELVSWAEVVALPAVEKFASCEADMQGERWFET